MGLIVRVISEFRFISAKVLDSYDCFQTIIEAFSFINCLIERFAEQKQATLAFLNVDHIRARSIDKRAIELVFIGHLNLILTVLCNVGYSENEIPIHEDHQNAFLYLSDHCHSWKGVDALGLARSLDRVVTPKVQSQFFLERLG